MKTRTLAALFIAIALPAAAQASEMTSAQFEAQREALNTQVTAETQTLPSAYAFDTVKGGHSAAADQALSDVAEASRVATDIVPGSDDLIAEGQSVAAAQALQNVDLASDAHGAVDVSLASR